MFGPGCEHVVPPKAAGQNSVRSQMVIAVHTKAGQPWLFGIHECAREQVWSAEEQEIFTAIGRRIGDALGTLLTLKALRENEERMRLLTADLPGVVYSQIYEPRESGWTWTPVYLSSGITELLGERFGAEVLEDHNRLRGLIHPDDLAAYERMMEQHSNDTSPTDFEYRVRSDSGDYKWVRSIARVKPLGGGRCLWHGLLLDVTDRKRAEGMLRFTQFSIDNAADAAFWLGSDGRLLYANEAAQELTGYAHEELLEMSIHDFVPGFPRERWPYHWQALKKSGALSFEVRAQAKDGRRFPVVVSANMFESEGREYDIAFMRDISQRKDAEEEKERLEAQLRQAQKMEAIGQLAGGVAHDFNNILTTILGHADLALASLSPESSGAEGLRLALKEIERGARHATGLTRQLLVFSRRDVAKPVVFDLGRTLVDMQRMLGRLISEEIELEIEVADDEYAVRANKGQIEQVVMNLVINAHDAMPTGGKVTLRTERVQLDAGCPFLHSDARPGPHVMLSVADSGCGMCEKTAERIFEPFFTTKPVGRGSGLGLSVVYGIVRRADGSITVDSEPGRGTTFRIYLPACEDRTELGEQEEAPLDMLQGTETVLVCEDDPGLRDLTGQMLRDAGYRTLLAEDGERALELAQAHGGTIHLLLTDLVMPRMNGRRLAETLTSRSPDLKTLFVSGYAADVLAERDLLHAGCQLLEKPFTMKALLRHVRQVLDE
jgi:PAS domain S-box-containing protein